jgi:hypothetical protein
MLVYHVKTYMTVRTLVRTLNMYSLHVNTCSVENIICIVLACKRDSYMGHKI